MLKFPWVCFLVSYLWCFDNSEVEYTKKALDSRDNVCHIVIYSQYYHKLTQNKNQVEPYYFVAAAALFIISDSQDWRIT